jgi:hypothetical protein
MKKIIKYMKQISPKTYYWIIGLLVVELLSFIGWFNIIAGNSIFILAILAFLYISIKKPVLAIGIMLIELIIGSQGYLFAYSIGFSPDSTFLSIRIAIFLILFFTSFFRAIKQRKIHFLSSKILLPYCALIASFLFALINGYLQNNGAGLVFADGNGYFYFGAALFLWQEITSKEQLMELFIYAKYGLISSLVKIGLILYIFSHKMLDIMPYLYSWIRDTRVGEITIMTPDAPIHFYRIFFQSQVYTVIAFFIAWVLSLVISQKVDSLKSLLTSKKWWKHIAILTPLFASIVISLSRSFWVGMIVAGLIMLLLLFIFFNQSIKKIRDLILIAIPTGILSIVLMTAIVLFPFPLQNGGFSAGSLISNRLQDQNAVSSRWELLDSLNIAIKEHFVLGAGYGKQVTYVTQDPRIRAENPTGEYTTYAFEWGYHDFALKLGMIGLFIYFWLLCSISWQSLMRIKNQQSEYVKLLHLGFFLGGVMLLITHIFSPYLNHPLGISYLLFWQLMNELYKGDMRVEKKNKVM